MADSDFVTHAKLVFLAVNKSQTGEITLEEFAAFLT
jgi:hypothetical protein